VSEEWGWGVGGPEWKDLVREASAAIRQGQAEKVVLARAERVTGHFSAERTLERLRSEYPGCTLFALAQGEHCFLGATPERLVALRDRIVEVSAVAGTIGRGRTPEEDFERGAQLLASTKDRSEHDIVVRMVRDSLASVCVGLTVADGPELMRLRNVFHLSTPITGRLANGETVLTLASRLHPTPAVSGFPRQAAMSFIREREGLDRGWYAGPLGWVNRSGDGDFVVAIRSALLGADAATLFAGCGIMADSDPESEFAESCLKLESMLLNLVPEE
jgi:isochorismate synthase